MSVNYELRGHVAVLTLNNPPVNGLGYETRKGLTEGLERAQTDPAVLAIVITGAEKAFSGGADIREFGSPKAFQEPSLRSVISALEISSKPVVAAIHSVCMGGGLELALGCHYRVCTPGTHVALPEVKLGLIPGAGGTQRLPRVVGVENALNMIVSGETVKSEQLAMAPGQRLFDKMIDGDLMAGALAFALKIAQVRPLPLVRHLKAEHSSADAYFQFARNTAGTAARNLPAPLKCVDAVEAAVRLKFEEGMEFEREAFVTLLHSPQSHALRHVFMAERACAKVPGVPSDTPVRNVQTVGVIGAGTMGSGIAMNFLNIGMPVVLLESTQEALDKGVATIRKHYESQLKKGKLSQEKLNQRMGLLSPTVKYDHIKNVDLVIEAVYEDMQVKEQVFRILDEVMKPGAILATNTSTLDIDVIAAFTKRAPDVIGIHFFSPAHVMKLLEIIRGEKTAKDVLATVMQLGKKIKKTCVVSGVCDGFIGNRMIGQYVRQAGFLLDEGATPQQVDKAMETFGFAMGPFRMGDLAGNDVGWYVRKRHNLEKSPARYSKTADLLCEMGRFGQKTGAGWYDYGSGKREASSSPVVLEMIENYRAGLNIVPREISDEEIVQRLVYALVNEGAKIVEEGIALRASDIDMVYLTGYGFPAFRGGPMCYADSVGLFNVVTAMKRFAQNPHDDAAFWKPAPLLARLAAQGQTFSET